MLAAVLSIGLCFVFPVSAQTNPYILDINSKKVKVIDLGTLGRSHGAAYDINNVGQVVGYSDTAAGDWHAFVTGPNGVGMFDLGTLGGYSSRASDINDAGQVVGISTTATGTDHVFITDPSGVGMADLDSQVKLPVGFFLVPGLLAQINNVGQVTATIIPEPQSYALMLTGLILVGFMARRKSLLA